MDKGKAAVGFRRTIAGTSNAPGRNVGSTVLEFSPGGFGREEGAWSFPWFFAVAAIKGF